MSAEIDAAIAQMRREIDALSQMKTKEDHDEGARLHNIHNAPWKKGQYSHLEFEPYVFRAFPKMLYGLDYPDAVTARVEAEEMPAIGINDNDRKKALLLAERRIAASTCIVQSEKELRTLGSGWFETPDDVIAHKASRQTAKELGQAHRAHEDRRMGELAKREAEAFDDAAEDFTPEIPQTRKGPRAASGKRVGAGKR